MNTQHPINAFFVNYVTGDNTAYGYDAELTIQSALMRDEVIIYARLDEDNTGDFVLNAVDYLPCVAALEGYKFAFNPYETQDSFWQDSIDFIHDLEFIDTPAYIFKMIQDRTAALLSNFKASLVPSNEGESYLASSKIKSIDTLPLNEDDLEEINYPNLKHFDKSADQIKYPVNILSKDACKLVDTALLFVENFKQPFQAASKLAPK